MIRFAVPPIGGQNWFGGWMYMRNLVQALALHGDHGIQTCVFVGPDRADDSFILEMSGLPRTDVIVDSAFAIDYRGGGTLRTVFTGRRDALLNSFAREKVDVVLDWATYYGWRSEIPAVAWIPDFQHRVLPHLFGKLDWYRREVGFRLQIAASAKIMLSSSAAELDCNTFYPSSRGKTHVARFAVPIDGWPEAPAAEKLLEVNGIPRDFVFIPNQLWQHKNHLLAIESASVLARRGSKRVIVATGRGSDPRRSNFRSELINHIETAGAAANFMLLDGVDHELVKAMLTMTNAMLNPSQFEGWSTPVEEAKAIGTPMLLSDIPVHREQAPEAKFFGLDDATALADAIEASPVRALEAIAQSAKIAAALNAERQIAFAQSVAKAVKLAAEGHSSGVAR